MKHPKLFLTIALVFATLCLFLRDALYATSYFVYEKEAEDCFIQEPLQKSIHEKASKVYFVELPEDSSSIAGELAFSFITSRQMDAYLWLRVRLPNSASNTISVIADGATRAFEGYPLNEWIWQRVPGSFRLSGYYDYGRYRHTIKVTPQERGVQIDKIIIAENPGIPDEVLSFPPVLGLGIPPKTSLLINPGFENSWSNLRWVKYGYVIPIGVNEAANGNQAVKTGWPSTSSYPGKVWQNITIPKAGNYRFCALGQNGGGTSKGYLKINGVKVTATPTPWNSTDWQEYCTPVVNFPDNASASVELGSDCRTCYFNWDDTRIESLTGNIQIAKQLTVGDALLYETDNFDYYSIITQSIRSGTTFGSDANKYLGIYLYMPGSGIANQTKWVVNPGYYRVLLKNEAKNQTLAHFILKVDDLKGMALPLGHSGDFSIKLFSCPDNILDEINSLRQQYSIQPPFGFYPDSLNLISHSEEARRVLQPYIDRSPTLINEARIKVTPIQNINFPLTGLQNPALTAPANTAGGITRVATPDPGDFLGGTCTFTSNENLLKQAFARIDAVNPFHIRNDSTTNNIPIQELNPHDYYSLIAGMTPDTTLSGIYKDAEKCDLGWKHELNSILRTYAAVLILQRLQNVAYNPGYTALNGDQGWYAGIERLSPNNPLYGVYGLQNGLSPCEVKMNALNTCCYTYFLPSPNLPQPVCSIANIKEYVRELEREQRNVLAYWICQARAKGYIGRFFKSPFPSDFECGMSATISGLKERANRPELTFTRDQLTGFFRISQSILNDLFYFYYYDALRGTSDIRGGGGALKLSFANYAFKPFDPNVDGVAFQNFAERILASIQIVCRHISHFVKEFFQGSSAGGNQQTCAELSAAAKAAVDTTKEGINTRTYARYPVSSGLFGLTREIISECGNLDPLAWPLKNIDFASMKIIPIFNPPYLSRNPADVQLTVAEKIQNEVSSHIFTAELAAGNIVEISMWPRPDVWLNPGDKGHMVLSYAAEKQIEREGYSARKVLYFYLFDPNNYRPEHNDAIVGLLKYYIGEGIFEYMYIDDMNPHSLIKLPVTSMVVSSLLDTQKDYLPRHQSNCPCVSDTPGIPGIRAGVNHQPPLCESCEKLGARPEPVTWDPAAPKCGNGRLLQ